METTYYTVKELAYKLAVGPWVIKEIMDRGEMGYIRVGRGRRVSEPMLQEWMAQHTFTSEAMQASE